MSSASVSSREKYHALLSSASKTAGCDNWKTAAGRTDGHDGFVAGDAWRLLKIHFKSTSKPPVCPVCMDQPSSDNDWYVTKSCKHTMCRECLQDYAASLVSDPNHSGPLKCPCCPRLLRVEDAKVALDKQPSVSKSQSVSMRKATSRAVMERVKSKTRGRGGLFDEPENDPDSIGNSALEMLEKWDNKKRDEMLRSMRDFRPCPHCSNIGTEGDLSEDNMGNYASNKGGGFVTPDCLAPINEERESKAEHLIRMAGNPSAQAVLLAYAIYYLYCTGYMESRGRTSAALQLMLTIFPAVLLPTAPHAIRLALSTMARKEIMRPIVVTCPCCNKDFNLAASSELNLGDASSDTAAETATQRWKNSNTRPCPGCASPIMKDGGCNHVKCGKCRVDFCWGCMRSRTSCQAYQCKNGAPFGNAFGDGSMAAVRAGLVAGDRVRQAGQTLIERIDNVEAVAMRNLGLWRFPLRYLGAVGILLVCLALLYYIMQVVMSVVANSPQRVMSVVASSPLTSLGLLCIVIICSLISTYVRRLGMNNDLTRAGARQRHQQISTRGFNQLNRRRSRIWDNMRMVSSRRPGFRTEEDQLAEAIARSLAEQ